VAQGCLRGSQVQSVRLTTLAVEIPVGRLQAKAEVLLGVRSGINLPRRSESRDLVPEGYWIMSFISVVQFAYRLTRLAS
jgi:hypothetical protein